MSILLIGAHGLVGSAFARYFQKNGIPFRPVLRADMPNIAGTSCDLVINCSGNGNKGKANENPHWDFSETVESTSYYVHNIDAQKFIHISSVDVYTDPADIALTVEAKVKINDKQSTYGFHKYLAESCVRQFANSPLVLRLPALVGPNLKKNPIFDHFCPAKRLFIAADSELNVVHTDFVAEAAFSLLEQNISETTLNLAAQNSLKISDLPNISGIENHFHEGVSGNKQCYKVNTALASQYLNLPTSEASVQTYMQEIT